MGETATKPNEGIAGQTQNQPKRGRGRPPKDTQRETAAGATSTRAGGTTEGTTEEIEVITGLATVENKTDGNAVPDPEPPKRGRGRPPGSTNKRTTKTAAAKKNDTEQTTVMIQTLLSVVFGITAARAGEHWNLSPEEARQLAQPMAAILDRHDLSDKMGAYGDYIALVAAIGMIIVPKVMVSMELSKQKKGVTNNVRHLQPKQAEGTPAGADGHAEATTGSHRPVQRTVAHHRPSDVKQSLSWLEG